MTESKDIPRGLDKQVLLPPNCCDSFGKWFYEIKNVFERCVTNYPFCICEKITLTVWNEQEWSEGLRETGVKKKTFCKEHV